MGKLLLWIRIFIVVAAVVLLITVAFLTFHISVQMLHEFREAPKVARPGVVAIALGLVTMLNVCLICSYKIGRRIFFPGPEQGEEN